MIAIAAPALGLGEPGEGGFGGRAIGMRLAPPLAIGADPPPAADEEDGTEEIDHHLQSVEAPLIVLGADAAKGEARREAC